MKTISKVITIVAIAHLLALIGFIGFLIGTNRLNRERVDAVRDIFMVTIPDEVAAKEAEVKVDEEKKQAAMMESLKDDPLLPVLYPDGPDMGGAMGLNSEQRSARMASEDELLREREMRFTKDQEHLKRTLEEENRKLQKGWDDLRANQAAFQAEIERQRKLRDDEQFQKMVSILKGLPAKDIKGKLDAFLAQKKMDLVIDILDAFDARTSQKVMKEYKSVAENALAAELLERLKDRGMVASGS